MSLPSSVILSPSTFWWGVIGGRKTSATPIITRLRWSWPAETSMSTAIWWTSSTSRPTSTPWWPTTGTALNDLPEFAGLNPSIEHFARIFCRQLKDRIKAATLTALQVKIWETGIAWAAYREEV